MKIKLVALVAIVICLLLVFSFSSCKTTTAEETTAAAEETTAAAEETTAAEQEEVAEEGMDEIDPWIVEVRSGLEPYRLEIPDGFIGPTGKQVTSDSELFLTKAEVKKIQNGKENGEPYTLVIAWHTLASVTDYGAAWRQGILDTCEYLGIKVVGETDADYNTDKQKSDVETLIALKPDLMIAITIDYTTAYEIFKPAVNAGIKISLVSNVPDGFVHGEDYIGVTTYDPNSTGVFQADITADVFGENGRIGNIFWQGTYWPYNYQDRIMRETFKNKYPNLEIVEDVGFMDVADAGNVANAIIQRSPDIDGFFVAWMDPGQYVLTTIKESGKDYKFTVNSINNVAMMSMATDGIIAALVTDCPYFIGVNAAICAAYGLVDKPGPAYAVSPVVKVTKENIREGWFLSTNRPLSEEVEKVLKEQGL